MSKKSPKDEKQAKSSIRVDEELWREAKIHAIRLGITLTDFLQIALKDAMKKYKSDKELKEDAKKVGEK